MRTAAALMVLLSLPSLGAVPWPAESSSRPLADRIPAPEGFTRVAVAPESFGAWLRQLPVLEGHPTVRLHDGRRKENQSAQAFVLDIDVGTKDLQQCADAVIRLRAEYLRAAGRADEICFRATSGDAMPWKRWSVGERPEVAGSSLRWVTGGRTGRSYASFREYLERVFVYAGSASLARGLAKADDPRRVEPGDVFIQGGFPGHAVIVADVAESADGQRMFLLAQSYMPAQQIHVLRNPTSDSPWYPARGEGRLDTPEWRFRYEDLRRFPRYGCP